MTMISEQRTRDAYRYVRLLRRAVTIHRLLFSLALVVTVHGSVLTALAQRDYFTDQEVEMVRDAQQIDQRINLLVKVIDRRFEAAGIDVGGAKFAPKDAEKWGELKGTRGDMLLDIKRVLQKAIDDIDNVAAHPDTLIFDPADPDKKPKNFSSLFPKAVRLLAKAAERYKGPLQAALDVTKDQKERGSILDSLEMCDEIIASVAKLPAETKKAKN